MAGPDAIAPADGPAEPEWIALLRAEARKRTVAAVAREVGIARPSLSMLLKGTYPAGLDRLTAKVEPVALALYRDQVPCPHLGAAIGREACRAHAGAPMSASDPARLRHWAACRACPLNPLKGGPA